MSGLVLLAPRMLLLALALPVAAWWRARSSSPAKPLPSLALFGEKPLPRTWRVRFRFLPGLLVGAGLLLAVFALARPAVREELPLRKEGLDIFLVLDVSSSMRERDLDPQRTRLQVARDAAATFIEGRPGDRIGLVTFARYPDLRSPLTQDHRALGTILDGVQTVASDSAEDATGIGTAVARATQVLTATGARGGVIILLTDGEENVALRGTRDEIPPVQAGQLGQRLGVRVYPIAAGVGRRDAAGAWVPIDTRPLRDLASRTGGAFYAARDARAVDDVYAQIDQLEKARFEEPRTTLRDAYRPILIGALLLLLLGAMLAVTVFDVRPHAPSRGLRWGLFAAGALAAALSLAGPSFGDEEDETAWGGVDLVALLDVSRSMLAQDVDPSRLARAQADLQTLADRALGDRLGLVVFAGEARVVAPLTRDRVSFASLAASADPTAVRRGGTDLGVAIHAGVDALREAEQEGAQILLLTDGEDLAGEGLAAAERARDAGITVHAVGYGSARGSKIAVLDEAGERYLRDRAGADVVSVLDTTGLERLTAATGGSFHRADVTPHAITTLYDDRVLPRARAVQAEAHRRPANDYQVPLLLAFVLWLAAILWRRRAPPSLAALLVLGLVVGGCDATAEGREAYARGDYDAALASFREAASRNDPSEPLLYDLALAALRVEAWDEAEDAARALEARGSGAFRGPAAFVRGNVAFARSLAAEAAMARDATDPRARLRTTAYAEDAVAAWQVAAASRADWPAARRNVERGLRRLNALREKRGPPPPPRPKPPPPPPPQASAAEEEAKPPTVVTRELPPEQVLDVLERLKQKEQEKRRVRQRERRVLGEQVERDW